MIGCVCSATRDTLERTFHFEKSSKYGAPHPTADSKYQTASRITVENRISTGEITAHTGCVSELPHTFRRSTAWHTHQFFGSCVFNDSLKLLRESLDAPSREPIYQVGMRGRSIPPAANANVLKDRYLPTYWERRCTSDPGARYTCIYTILRSEWWYATTVDTLPLLYYYLHVFLERVLTAS